MRKIILALSGLLAGNGFAFAATLLDHSAITNIPTLAAPLATTETKNLEAMPNLAIDIIDNQLAPRDVQLPSAGLDNVNVAAQMNGLKGEMLNPQNSDRHIAAHQLGELFKSTSKTGDVVSAEQGSPIVDVRVQLSVDPAAPFSLKNQLNATLSVLKDYGFVIKGKPHKTGAYTYFADGAMPKAKVKDAFGQEIGGVDGINILRQPRAQKAFTAAALVAPTSQTRFAPFETKSLNKSSKVQKKIDDINDQWDEDNIMNGSVDALSGQLILGKSDLNPGQLKATAESILADRFIELDENPVKGPVTSKVLPVKAAVTAAVSNLTEGFVYDPKNKEVRSGLYKNVYGTLKALGPLTDLIAVSAAGKGVVDGIGDGPLHIGAVMFVNKKTNQYVVIYSREGTG